MIIKLIRIAVTLMLTFFCLGEVNAVSERAEYSNASSLAPNLMHKPPLRISVIKSAPPFNIQLENGHITGLYVEFWRLWSKYNNREVEFVSGTFLQNMDDLKNLRVDFHSGLFMSEKRKDWAEFSLPIHQVNTSLYTLGKKNHSVKLENMSGKTILIPEGSYQANYFKQKYPEITFVTFIDNFLMMKQLLNGEFDALIGEEPYVDSLLIQLGMKGIIIKSKEKLLSNLVYALFPKEKAYLIDEINTGIKNIPVNEITALERKWISRSKPYFNQYIHPSFASLSMSEITWLGQHSTWLVGSDPDWEPIEFIGKDRIFKGIAIEYLDIIQKSLNIEIKYVYKNKWEDLLNKANKGELDLLSAITKTTKRETLYNFSNPFISFPVVIMTRKDGFLLTGMADLVNVKIGAVKGGHLGQVLNEEYQDLTITNTETIIQGLNWLSEGKIDAFVGNQFLIAHYIEILKFDDLKLGLFTDHKIALNMATPLKQSPLISIINKVLSQVNNREKVRILNQWKGKGRIVIGDQFERFLLLGIPIIIIAFSLFIYVSISNRKMNHEINSRKHKEISLDLERKKYDMASRAKDEFLANMSHELRTPMNAILGTAYLLDNSGLSNHQKAYVETINLSANDLLYLINNILDLSKAEAGKLTLESQSFNLKNLCESTLNNLFSEHNKQINNNPMKIKKQLKLHGSLPDWVVGDPYRLKQILTNIISNSLKFTKEGSISLWVRVKNEKKTLLSNQLTLIFEVQDTGMGMDEEQLKKLFFSFNQADSSTTRNQAGAGLGLKLCKELCLLMGGGIRVESSLSEGSHVYVEVILEKETKENQDIENKKIKNCRLLVVDDNPINLIVTKKMLEKHLFKVDTVNSGIEAINALERKKYDAIFMDIQMPEMDGFETALNIRNGCCQDEIPILAFSASVSYEEQKKVDHYGMNGYLNKPINIEQVMEKLFNVIR